MRLARALVLVALLAACTGSDDDTSERQRTPTTSVADAGEAGYAPSLPPPSATHPRGGSVRVAVWGEPEPDVPTLAGAAVRDLVLPQLFEARPDGRWEASLVQPDSDRTAPDRRSATFKLVPRSAWSDGSPITADDLRRSADIRFVAGIDGPAADGSITVRFTQALPGWRRLWSGIDAVAAPKPGVWGGPFVVASVTPGLETVLRRNPRWAGGGPFLDEVRLVLVPDPTTEQQLLERGQLDVVMPIAATRRIAQLEALAGVEVATVRRGGWWMALLLNVARAGDDVRRAVVSTVDRRLFVDTLMRDEATLLDGLLGPEDATWRDVAPGSARGLGKVELTGTYEEPMTGLLQRAMQKRARAHGGELELRNAQADEVHAWVASDQYQVALVPQYDGPVVCWTCRWGPFSGQASAAADAGDVAAAAALQVRLRDERRVLPLWRPVTAVAWRGEIEGVVANGYALSAAWNAARWWRPPADQKG